MDGPRRVTSAVRRVPPPVEEVEQPPVVARGFEEPFVYARRLVRGEADLTSWILHTGDCELAPHRPVSQWPTKCGDRDDRQAAYGTLAPREALAKYLDLGNEACALCKPGLLLRETIPGHDELNQTWALRGGA